MFKLVEEAPVYIGQGGKLDTSFVKNVHVQAEPDRFMDVLSVGFVAKRKIQQQLHFETCYDGSRRKDSSS